MKNLRMLFLLFLFSSFQGQAQTILFMGDSLTEGFQLAKEDAFPALVEKELKKDNPKVKVINGGVAGATSASGLKRLDWYLKAAPDILVLILGGNDGLRGLKPKDTETNLSAVVEKAQERSIKVVLGGMQMPTNYGEPYRKEFEALFPKIAKKYKLRLIPFVLEGVGGKSELNLPDGIHPNKKGHEVMAKTVLNILKEEL